MVSTAKTRAVSPIPGKVVTGRSLRRWFWSESGAVNPIPALDGLMRLICFLGKKSQSDGKQVEKRAKVLCGEERRDMHVTICIATRNQGSGIKATLRSISALEYDDFDVVIVDQSSNDETAHTIQAETAGDPRYTYIHSQSVGKSVACNMLIAHARGPIVAFTDDDCEVSPDWLSKLVDYFNQYPDAGEICGEVQAIPYDHRLGYIPAFKVPRFQRVSSPWIKWRAHGIGANIAFRREALIVVGPFDEVLGPGAPLHNCEDGDYTYRVLKAGYSVLNVPDAAVLHSGFRPWTEGRRIRRYALLSVGACCMKHLRMGDLAILPTLFYVWFGRCIYWKNLLLFRRNSGLTGFVYYAWGMILSFRYRLDRRRHVYLLPGKKSITLQTPAADAVSPPAD